MLPVQTEFNITVYSHFFITQPISARARAANRDFLLTLVEHSLTKKQGRWTTEPDKTYAWKDERRQRYHLHINCYDDYMHHLLSRGFQEEELGIHVEPLFTPAPAEFSVVDTYVPREAQAPVIKAALEAVKQFAITAQMGGGKTLMFMFIAAAMGVRFSMRSKGGWSGRWATAFTEYLGFTENDYVICNGAKALYSYIKKHRQGKMDHIKAVYISNGAIRSLINDYGTEEQDDAMGGIMPPWELYRTLGIGLVGVDEAHLEMHTHVLADLMTHTVKRIALTGTLESRDTFKQKIYQLYLPKHLRRDLGALHVYVNAFEAQYNLSNTKPFEKVIRATVYSHNEFENVILKHKEMLERYMEAWYRYIVRTWMANRIYDSKIIVFCGLVEMGAHLTEFLKRRFPDLRVAQYKAGDSDDVLEDNDMLVSTALKAGTAVDISRLTRVYNLISVDSPNTLLQIMGRLRFLKDMADEGFHYHQGVCMDIPKQVDYMTKRKLVLAPRVIDIRPESLELLL